MIPLIDALYYTIGFGFMTIIACGVLLVVASIGKARR